MATKPTTNPIPSESPRDLKFNAGKIDEIVNSSDDAYQDRFGKARLTWAGIEAISKEAISNYGYITVESFEDGFTITLPNQVLLYEANGEYYRWNGSLPKVVPAGSLPGDGWVSVGDASLRSNLSSPSNGLGDSLIAVKQPISNSVRRTVHDKFYEQISVKDFGVIGDGNFDDSEALQSALNACIGKDITLYFPPGKYKVTKRINIPLGSVTHLCIAGSGTHQTTFQVYGSQELFNITGDFGNYWLNTVTPNSSFEMNDVTISCFGGLDNSGTAINFDMGSQLGRPNHGLRFRNLTIKTELGYFAYGVIFNNCAQINLDSCRFFSGNGVQSGIGILGQCSEGQDGGGMFVNNCEFFFYEHGIYVRDRFEGTYITSSAFINCKYGTTAVEAGSESGMLITNSEYDCMSEGIHFEGMFDFVITGNCFLGIDADSQIAIFIKNGAGFTITGNKIQGVLPTNGSGIVLENTNDSLGRASYIGGNAIGTVNIGMSIKDCKNITFGPWAWKDCTSDTQAFGTNTFIQQSCYEKTTSLVQTLSASTSEWTISVDISDMRLSRIPKFATLVSNSASNMNARYDYSSSSVSAVVFKVTLGTGAAIAPNAYRFSLSVRQPFFDI